MLNQAQHKVTKEAELLTLAEAADYLKISPRMVIRYKVPHYSLGQKTKLFKKEDILNWLETRRK